MRLINPTISTTTVSSYLIQSGSAILLDRSYLETRLLLWTRWPVTNHRLSQRTCSSSTLTMVYGDTTSSGWEAFAYHLQSYEIVFFSAAWVRSGWWKGIKDWDANWTLVSPPAPSFWFESIQASPSPSVHPRKGDSDEHETKQPPTKKTHKDFHCADFWCRKQKTIQ